MHRDPHDLPITTVSAEAAAHFGEGLKLMLSAWPGPAAAFRAAIAADPEFALAHVALARAEAMAGHADIARDRILTAQTLAAANGTERERSHVAVIAMAMAGRTQAALEAALAHADRWPRDVVILSLPMGAFGLFAFSGMADHDQARTALCERHAARFGEDDWWFLTTYGWALSEDGQASRGRPMVEEAFRLRRANANTVHALAHALWEGGASQDAEGLIAEWLPTYDPSGVLHGHLAWHRALVALERGDADEAMAIYAKHVQPSVSQGMAINVVTDAASLFWRLGAYGRSVPRDRWSEVERFAHAAFPSPGHAFIDSHMALIEAAMGDRAALDRRIEALDRLVASGALAAGPVVPAIARAARAWAAGDFGGCADLLEPQAAEIARIGGSGAQREMIEDMLILSLARAGRTETARARLDRRLARRRSPRDAAWLGQLAAGRSPGLAG